MATGLLGRYGTIGAREGVADRLSVETKSGDKVLMNSLFGLRGIQPDVVHPHRIAGGDGGVYMLTRGFYSC